MSLAEEIEKTEVELFLKKAEIEEYQAAKDSSEAFNVTLVSDSKGVDGKPAYTNAEARKAEVELRLSKNEAFQDILTKIRNVQQKKMIFETRANRLRAEMSLIKAFLHGGGND